MPRQSARLDARGVGAARAALSAPPTPDHPNLNLPGFRVSLIQDRFCHSYEFVLQPPAHAAAASRARGTPVIGLRRASFTAVEIPPQLWVCAAASRARGTPVIGLRRASSSLLPRRRFRNSYGFVLQPPARPALPQSIAGTGVCCADCMGLCCSLPRARHSRDRIAEGQFQASPRLRSWVLPIGNFSSQIFTRPISYGPTKESSGQAEPFFVRAGKANGSFIQATSRLIKAGQPPWQFYQQWPL